MLNRGSGTGTRAAAYTATGDRLAASSPLTYNFVRLHARLRGRCTAHPPPCKSLHTIKERIVRRRAAVSSSSTSNSDDCDGGNNGGRGGRDWHGGSGDDGQRPNHLLAMLVALVSTLAGTSLLWAEPASAAPGLPAYTPQELETMTTLPTTIEQQMAAVKRLLRDLFSDQLAIKGRLTALEASSEDPAAADLDALEVATLGTAGKRSSSSNRAAVHITGVVELGGGLAWLQDATSVQSAGSQQPLSQQQASSWSLQQPSPTHNALTLYLHSLFGHAKQHRLTAKLQPLAAAAEETLQQVLCRSELSPDLHLLLAPTGGSLQAIAPLVNEFSGPFASPSSGSSSSSSSGSTGSALVAGHGLYGPAASGTGAGLTWMAGDLSASAGSFLSGTGSGTLHQHSCAQVSLGKRQEYSVTAVLGHSRATGWADPSWQQHKQQQGAAQQHEQFQALQQSQSLAAAAAGESAGAAGSNDAAGSASQAASRADALPSMQPSRATLGLCVASVIDDGLVLSAWAQKELLESSRAAGSSTASSGTASSAEGAAVQAQQGAPGVAGNNGVSWGVALQSQPDSAGRCLGIHLGQAAGGRWACEAAMRLPVAPGVLLLPRLEVQQTTGGARVNSGISTQWRF